MNKNYGVFGLAKQPDNATAVTVPTVGFMASASSNGIETSKTLTPIQVTQGGRSTTTANFVESIESTATVTTLGFANFLAQSYAAAMGSDVVSGTEAPYTHDIKASDADIEPYTFVQQIGSPAAALQYLQGCKVTGMKMSASGNTPPSFELSLAGTAAKYMEETAWAGGDPDPSVGFYQMAGATVQFSTNTSIPADAPANITLTDVDVEIANSNTAESNLGSPIAKAQSIDDQVITCSLKGTSDDTTIYREVMTGTQTGTDTATTVVTGSLQITFTHSVHEDWKFVIKIMSIPWNISVMGVDVTGGKFDLELSTDGAITTDGTAAEFLVDTETNDEF